MKCDDSRMPRTPMTIREAEIQAAVCDVQWPECGPHIVYEGEPAMSGYQ